MSIDYQKTLDALRSQLAVTRATLWEQHELEIRIVERMTVYQELLNKSQINKEE